ncbi:MAG: response regulator [Longimicrobiaceae bacterium]
MRSVLIAGLPGHFGTWLADRLPGISVQMAFSAGEAEEQASAGDSLLLIDLAVGADETTLALRRLRAGAGARVPVIVTIDVGASGVNEALLDRLVRGLNVDRLLFHPLDRSELLRAVSGLLGEHAAAAPAPSGPPSPAAAAGRERVAGALGELWPRARATMLDRVAVLEQAARAASDGRLVGALRQRAADEAHRLAGALGTFGVPEGTRLARELETRYAGGAYLTAGDGAELAEAAARLRAEIEGRAAEAPAGPAQEAAGTAPAGDTLLVLTADGAVLRAAREAFDGGAVRVAGAAGLQGDGAGPAPGAVLLDLASGEGEWRTLSQVAARFPGVAVIVATARGDLPDRLQAVQLGARGFLQKPLSAESVRDAVAAVLPAPGRRPRILCVDDDPALLAAVEAVLGPRGIEVHTLDDPLHFWTRLGEVAPDLLVLDIDMPHVNGIELCRVVRADPRRRSLPVVFLTARVEPETVYRVFAAGADDYVAKPFVGPELEARIRNRLDRVRR